MGNLVKNFGEVTLQIWESLFHYHTLDFKWKYNPKGFEKKGE